MLEVASFELLTQENITLSQRSLRLPRKLRSLSCAEARGSGCFVEA